MEGRTTLQCTSVKGFQMTWNLAFDLESLLATLEVPENLAERGKCIFRSSDKDLGQSQGEELPYLIILYSVLVFSVGML